MPTDETILVLGDLEFPVGSARGITQTLEPISASAQMRRNIDGNLIDISLPQLRRYQSTISCNDQAAPTFDNFFPGELINPVDCIAELTIRTGGSQGRAHVPGSMRTEGSITSYRPRLAMRVMSFNINKDEWGAAVGWTLSLTEDYLLEIVPDE